MKSIIFICTGNICRSPMAEHYMQKRVYDLNKQKDYIIDSCGIYAVTGEKATKNAIEAMIDFDVNMNLHRAKNIAEVDLINFDLIICLTYSHKLTLINMFPSLKDKIFTLKEYVDPNCEYKDIDDPWGLSINVYKQCAKEITKYVDYIVNKF